MGHVVGDGQVLGEPGTEDGDHDAEPGHEGEGQHLLADMRPAGLPPCPGAVEVVRGNSGDDIGEHRGGHLPPKPEDAEDEKQGREPYESGDY